MKKLYTTLALAAAVALSASAVDSKKFSKEMKVAEGLTYEMAVDAVDFSAPVVAKAPQQAKPTSRDQVLGYYDFKWFSGSEKVWQSGILAIEPGKGANDLLLYGFYGVEDNDGALNAVFDPANATITVPDHQPAFFASNYNEQVYYNHGVFGADGSGATDGKPLVIQVDDNGALVFGQSDFMSLDISKGHFEYIYRMSATPLPAMTDANWREIGDALFTDGWYCPWWYDQVPQIEVKMQQNVTNPNYYRLVNPYKFLEGEMITFPSGAQNDLNSNTGEGCIVFDLSLKDCVLVLPNNYSGLYDKDWGSGFWFCYNASGDMFVNDETFNEENTPADERLEEIKNWFPEEERSMYDEESRTLVVPFCQFTATEFGTLVHTWDEYLTLAGETGVTVEQTAVIVFPNESGINNIVTDASNNAPVEYFNLQGIRVNNPENGVFIRRQGKNVTKVVK